MPLPWNDHVNLPTVNLAANKVERNPPFRILILETKYNSSITKAPRGLNYTLIAPRMLVESDTLHPNKFYPPRALLLKAWRWFKETSGLLILTFLTKRVLIDTRMKFLRRGVYEFAKYNGGLIA